MTSRVTSIAEAYAALGVSPGAGLTAAKASFRERVKHLHPDTTAPTPETLSQLADIVAAIRFLEAALPACMEIDISGLEAENGVSRTLRLDDRPVIVRIPSGTTDGAMISPVGEPDITLQIRVRAEQSAGNPRLAGPVAPDIDAFVQEFSRPSANARFARWIRNAQSAA